MIILFSLLNALAVSCSNVFGGLATRRMPLTAVMLVAGPSALGVAVALALTGLPDPSAEGMAIGLLAGVAGGIGVPLAYRALAIGPVGVAATIVACVSTGIVATTGMVLGSSVTPLRIAGLVLCATAILLVSRRRTRERSSTDAGPLFAVGAGSMFGFFVVTMNATPPTDGWWPLVGARIGVLMVTAAMVGALARRSGPRLSTNLQFRRGAILMAVAAGALDITGNFFLVLALREGDLLLVAILTSVSPVATATLGWVLLRERLEPLQVVGIVAAVFAVAATSI